MTDLIESTDSRAERYLRFSRRGMIVVLVLVLVLGASCLAMALRPESASPKMVQAGSILFLAITLSLGVLQRTLRGARWNPDVPEVRAIMQDEWRRASMDRAIRIALTVVLIAQVPIGLALSHLPTLRAVMAMATVTTMLGMATLIAFFLYFDRETHDVE